MAAVIAADTLFLTSFFHTVALLTTATFEAPTALLTAAVSGAASLLTAVVGPTAITCIPPFLLAAFFLACAECLALFDGTEDA